jgi:CheY-like chemotaxis protein
MKLILVVDDDAVHRELVKDILEMHGHTKVIAADSVRSAIKKFSREYRIGTIISDYRMPDGCGDDLHRTLLPALKKRDVHFIAMSSLFPEAGNHYFAHHGVPRVDKTKLVRDLPEALKR